MLFSKIYRGKDNAFQAAVSRGVACWLVTVWAEWDDEMRLAEDGVHTDRQEALRHARASVGVYAEKVSEEG